MRTIRLDLAYDGADFAGWQIQPERRTVQGSIEDAIQKLTGESVRVLSAGRTDAGVHALGQVASFRTGSNIPAEKWRPALQQHLPHDLVVLESGEVDDEFHATFSATSKRYRYLIRTSVVEDPFLRRYAWRIGAELDVDRMQSAARALVGTHDFRCFESHWPNKATSVRTVLDATFSRLAHWPGWSTFPLSANPDADACQLETPSDKARVHVQAASALPSPLSTAHPATPAPFLVFEIEADGFLYNMVRAIVGTLVNIGRGRWPVAALAEIIAGQQRSLAGETAPPHGLYLMRVNYPENAGRTAS